MTDDYSRSGSIDDIAEHSVAEVTDDRRHAPFIVSNSIDDDLAGASGRSRSNPLAKNTGLIVLGLVVIAATALLFGMRRLGLRGHLDMLDIKIDYPIDAKTGKIAGANHDQVISQLRRSAEVVQVPAKFVQMNPFEWMAERDTESINVDAAADKLRQEQEQRLRKIDTAFSRLRLNSVMGGKSPVAQISGELVRVGDIVGEYFTVKHIKGRSVSLEAEGKDYLLTLGQ